MAGNWLGPLDRRRWMGAVLAVALPIWAAAAFASPRIVAVGDVHGDLAAFQSILREAGVIDAGGAWTGGETVLIQVGDLIDRGPRMRGCLDFAMALEAEAAKHGGRVVCILGNHEVMNMIGDLRYVTPANYAEFADGESEKRRADAWRRLVEFRMARARELGQPEPRSGAPEREAWLRAHPPGFLEHQEAFAPSGVYGRWLRGWPACFVAGNSAFLHGGLSPEFAGSSLEALDRRVHDDFDRFDADRELFVAQGLILPFFDMAETLAAVGEEVHRIEAAGRREVYERFLAFGTWAMSAEDGPLWFRGYSQWSDERGEAEMPRLLAAAGVVRFVVGHTVQPEGRIRVRFGATVFLIDTGMLASHSPGGRASALEIADGVVSAIYPGEPRHVLWQLPAKAAAALPVTSYGQRLVAADRR